MGDPKSNSISESSLKPEFCGQKNKNSSLSNVSGLFVGFGPKSSESDSVRSPTSPLDFWVFTNLASPYVRSPKSPHMKWSSSKVGLSIIESLDDINAKKSSNTRNILTKTPFLRCSIDTLDAPKSLPKNYGVFTRTQVKLSNLQKGSSDFVTDIGENSFEAESFGNFRSCSLDSGRTRLTNFSNDSSFENFGSKTRMSPLGSNPKQIIKNQVLGEPSRIPKPVSSAHDFIGLLSASEIELSEDYTCVKTFGPNPKTTHIFGDYVFECHQKNVADLSYIKEPKIHLEAPIVHLSDDFLGLCYFCKKKLEGKDIYMYRGEKAFCSPDCRSHEISLDEEREKKASVTSSKSSSKPNKTLMFII